MEEEIDLSQYIAGLMKYWYWIVGLAVVMAIIAFGVSTFIPPAYEATALVTATQPRYQLQFDPRFQNVPEAGIPALLLSRYRTYPTLATSDDLLQQVADETGWSLNKLRQALQATSDFNLFKLTVTGQDAQEAAKVANIWAEVFVKKVNTSYRGDNEVERLKEQQERAAQSLAQTDATLMAFREENGLDLASSVVGQQLQTNKDLLTHYKAELVHISQMRREVELLSTDIITSPALIAGLFSEMINSGIVRDSPTYQIRLDTVDPATSLAAMEKALASQVTAIEAETEPLRAEIATLQVELAAKQTQLEQLSREREVKTETFMTLSRKVQEVELEASGTGQVEVASQAAVPIEPAGPKRMLNTAIGGVVGLMLGVVGAWALVGQRNGQLRKLDPKEEP